MDRRGFLSNLSGSFILGTSGGAVVGAVGLHDYEAYMHGSSWKRSYAEVGEDLIVARLLDFWKVDRPTYLDIGAYEPIEQNNTYLLYRKGGKGVLVEPNPALTDKLKRVGPRDTTLNVGIGIAEPAADYYIIGGPSRGLLNTFSKEEADNVQSSGGGVHFIEKVIRMPLLNINDVMQDHFGGAAPDYVSIDTEGLDLEILKTMDFQRFRPRIVCVETTIAGTDKVEMEILDLLEEKHYSVRGATFMNTIFVDDHLLSEPGPLTQPPHARPELAPFPSEAPPS